MSSQKSLISTLPSGALCTLLRLPIAWFLLRLGWLLGQRFVLLQHIGRTSGRARTTFVEVIGHGRARDTYVIASGCGKRAQWYQNLLATPNILTHVGRRHLNMRAETVPPKEDVHIHLAYRQKYPPLYPRMKPGADWSKPGEGISRGTGVHHAGITANRLAPTAGRASSTLN